ncbi:MAG: GMP synthase [Bacteroidia bacterium]|nr:GMP synthase [Bacteroidia bacterium]
MDKLRVAILDMYNGEPNQGMRNIHQLLADYATENQIIIEKKVYDVRGSHQIPDLSYHAYISTGGPGSPIDTEGWEDAYLSWLHQIIVHNQIHAEKKHVFLICHSFQVVCYHFQLAKVCLRRSESFGIFPMHKTNEAYHNYITKNLTEPFYAVDSRKWQVIQPNRHNLRVMGAKILLVEKARHHVPYERATMAIQFTPEIFGTQFHPEADADGMILYLNNAEKKKLVIDNYGLKKYNDMLNHLYDPDKIKLTQSLIIPKFLDEALAQIKNLMLVL